MYLSLCMQCDKTVIDRQQNREQTLRVLRLDLILPLLHVPIAQLSGSVIW